MLTEEHLVGRQTSCGDPFVRSGEGKGKKSVRKRLTGRERERRVWKRVEHLNNALRRPANASCDRHIFRADALTLAHPLRARCTLYNTDDDDLPLRALPHSHPVSRHIYTHTIYLLSSVTPLVYPSLTYEWRRLSLEIVATKRLTVHIVPSTWLPSRSLSFSGRQKRAADDGDYSASDAKMISWTGEPAFVERFSRLRGKTRCGEGVGASF